jgi:hypothetical protein
MSDQSRKSPVLQSDRSDVATTFSSRELIDLPSFDHNFQAHLLLSPGTNQHLPVPRPLQNAE